MFLALSIAAFFGPSFVPTAECEIVKSGFNLTNFGNGSFAYQDIIFSPFASTSPKLYLLQSELPDLLLSPKYDLGQTLKNESRKTLQFSSEISKRNAPVRVPRVHSSKDYGKSSHYRMKGSRDPSRKSFYVSLLQKLLRPGKSRSPRKGKNYYSTSKYSSSPSQDWHYSSAPMDTAAGGWGWGWSGSKGHGHGVSLVDLLLCGLSLLSLGGFLLNLLLNLLNMFGFGMFTTTSTYPVTVTSTQTGTSTSTGGGVTTTGGTAVTLPTALSSGYASGFDITGRTIDSMAGWGQGGHSAFLKGHFKFGGSKGWPATTTTTTAPPTYPVDPTLTGTGGTANAAALFASGRRKKRRKREEFLPYVNPSTALNIFAKAVLNSIVAADNEYKCIEKVFCDNNKQARVIGQWFDYFMPVFSFSLSYFGHRVGAHESLLDHIRAIVLGVAETNCQTHFPRCDEITHP